MTGRALPPSSPFASDDGSPDPALASALAEYAGGDGPLSAVVAALADARVLVPMFASPGRGGGGAASSDDVAAGQDRAATSAVAALGAPDGRRALPVFTSVAAMAAWRADARPVPVPAATAALSAVREDWSLLVVDPAGPATAVIPRPAVWALARGLRWAPAVVAGEVDHAVTDAVTRAVSPIAHVASVGAEPGRSAEVAVALRLDPGLDRGGLDRVLAAVNEALAASSVIAERVDSLELRIGRA